MISRTHDSGQWAGGMANRAQMAVPACHVRGSCGWGSVTQDGLPGGDGAQGGWCRGVCAGGEGDAGARGWGVVLVWGD